MKLIGRAWYYFFESFTFHLSSLFSFFSLGVGESEEIGGGIKLFDEIPRIPQTQ
jgi:hypothetical protein